MKILNNILSVSNKQMDFLLINLFLKILIKNKMLYYYYHSRKLEYFQLHLLIIYKLTNAFFFKYLL